MNDTPSLGRVYCPTCEPNADPLSEILDPRWCDAHELVRSGADDDRITIESYPYGSAECGGESNRLWCRFFHRGRQK